MFSTLTSDSFNKLIVYVIGSRGCNHLNPLVTVSIGNVPPAAANCKTNIIKAMNFPISPKVSIKNSTIAKKQFAIKIILT